MDTRIKVIEVENSYAGELDKKVNDTLAEINGIMTDIKVIPREYSNNEGNWYMVIIVYKLDTSITFGLWEPAVE